MNELHHFRAQVNQAAAYMTECSPRQNFLFIENYRLGDISFLCLCGDGSLISFAWRTIRATQHATQPQIFL